VKEPEPVPLIVFVVMLWLLVVAPKQHLALLLSRLHQIQCYPLEAVVVIELGKVVVNVGATIGVLVVTATSLNWY
jgi:hypothetical protein